jgi:ABC-type transport system involved in multi-copper enzyme maturation permease subunit
MSHTTSAIKNPPATRLVQQRSYLATIVQLMRAEFHILRKRTLTKVLFAVALLIIVLSTLGTLVFTSYTRASSAESYRIPYCVNNGILNSCHPTSAQLEAYKQQQVVSVSNPLRLPGSLSGIVKTNLSTFLPVLIIILVGILVGGEYSLGTVRLMFTRGPTRIQYLLAKIMVASLCILIAYAVLIPFALLLGLITNPLSGVPQSYAFFSGTWFMHTLLFCGIGAFGWFVWSMMALCFAVLGRSTTSGLVAPLAWLSLESVFSLLIVKLAGKLSGPLADFLQAVPNYLIDTNIFSLLKNQSHSIVGDDPSPLSDTHCWIVLLVYTVVFMVIACLLTQRRDVTH